VVTGSVQYQDVGLKLDFEPQIYTDNDVGLKISLEVSTIVKAIAGPNGSLAYQIGTRNAQTVVRLHDGETQVLGGLIQSQDQNTAALIPGLGNLPVVGRLFGNNSGDRSKSEIVMSITPHIIRPPAVIDSSVREVFSGTESSLRQRALQLDPVGNARMQATSSGPATSVAPAAAGRPGGSTSAPAAPRAAQPANAPTPAPMPAQMPVPTPAPAPASNGAAPPPGTSQYMRNLLPYLNGSKYPAPAVHGAPAAAPEQPAAAAEQPAPVPADAPASDAKGSP
jgi:general secretion pathway protein D